MNNIKESFDLLHQGKLLNLTQNVLVQEEISIRTILSKKKKSHEKLRPFHQWSNTDSSAKKTGGSRTNNTIDNNFSNDGRQRGATIVNDTTGRSDDCWEKSSSVSTGGVSSRG